MTFSFVNSYTSNAILIREAGAAGPSTSLLPCGSSLTYREMPGADLDAFSRSNSVDQSLCYAGPEDLPLLSLIGGLIRSSSPVF